MKNQGMRFLPLFLAMILTLPAVAASHEAGETVQSAGKKGIIFIAMGPSNNFAMVDIATEKVMKAVAGAVNPHGIAVTPDGKKVFAVNRGENTFSEYSAPNLEKIRTITPGTGPGHVSVAPGGKYVYINDEAEAKTYIYDPEAGKVIHTVYLWPEPHEMTFFIPGR